MTPQVDYAQIDLQTEYWDTDVHVLGRYRAIA